MTFQTILGKKQLTISAGKNIHYFIVYVEAKIFYETYFYVTINLRHLKIKQVLSGTENE